MRPMILPMPDAPPVISTLLSLIFIVNPFTLKTKILCCKGITNLGAKVSRSSHNSAVRHTVDAFAPKRCNVEINLMVSEIFSNFAAFFANHEIVN